MVDPNVMDCDIFRAIPHFEAVLGCFVSLHNHVHGNCQVCLHLVCEAFGCRAGRLMDVFTVNCKGHKNRVYLYFQGIL